MKEASVDVSKIFHLSFKFALDMELVEEYSDVFSTLCLWFPVSTNYYEWNFDDCVVNKSPSLRSV